MGGSGESAPLVAPNNPAMDAAQQYSTTQASPVIQSIMAKVGSGQISLQDAIKMAQSPPSQEEYNAAMQSGDQQKILDIRDRMVAAQNPGAFMSALTTGPLTGSLVAQQQVMQDPTLRGIFNEGGTLNQAQDQYTLASGNLAQDREALLGRDQSYGLTDNDLAAYSQAAGNIARMFGGQEQSMASALANRGLAAGNSGVAQQGFSNLYGNKLEQLAGLQTQIATNRINTAKELAQARTQASLQQQAQAGSLVNNLGILGQNAQTNAYNRNLQGSQNTYNQMASAAGLGLQNQQMQQHIQNEKFAQEQATKGPSMGEVLGTAAGGALGAATGGFGAGIGASLGKSIGGSLGK